MADEEHLVVDDVVMQAASASVGVRIDGRPLPDGQVVQVWRRIRLPACPDQSAGGVPPRRAS